MPNTLDYPSYTPDWFTSSDPDDRFMFAELHGMGLAIQLWLTAGDRRVRARGFATWGPVNATGLLLEADFPFDEWNDSPKAQANALAWAASQTLVDVAVEHGHTRTEGTRQLSRAFIGREWAAQLDDRWEG